MITALKPAIDAADLTTHTHPIPNRDTIIRLLKKHGAALSRKQLATKMKLFEEQEREGLRRRLRAMERDGQIQFNRKRGYSALDETNTVVGRVIGHRDGFGFLVRDSGNDDLLLNSIDMRQLFDGDRAEVRLSGLDPRGREKATLVKVIERNTQQVIGKLCVDQGDYFIQPENSRNAYEIDIEHDHLNGAQVGQYVAVTLTHYPCHQYRAFGRVKEILGNPDAPGMEAEVTLREYGISETWPAGAERAAASMGQQVADHDKVHRLDLRDRPFVTIDGEDAKDFDDAVYCEPLGDGGWRLHVAIADVSHYVTPNSELDKEAQKRGTSVYFPGRVVPMLPEALSNGLCSLNPNVDRLVMVCEMTISAKGAMTAFQFSEAVIHSHARLTYHQVNAMLNKSESALGQKMRHKHSDLLPHITALHQLYGALTQARALRGSIDFDTQETQFQFNEYGKVKSIVPVIRNDAHKLIEECMLCANVATARFLSKRKLPALYRNHSGPTESKLDNLRDFLSEKQLKLSGGKKPSPADFDRLMSQVNERNDANAIKSVMLRSLSQAEYSVKNDGHFGLAYPAYTHFTSPIRRYPDLLVHRAIRALIRQPSSRGLMGPALKSMFGIKPKRSAYPYNEASMQAMATHCSALSRRADKASWDVEAWLKCGYMQDRLGEIHTGVITTVAQFGLFVELNGIKVEGLIHVRSLTGDFFNFDQTNQALVGNRAKRRYTVGDEVQVRIENVDMRQKKVEFRLVDPKSTLKKVRGVQH